MYSRHPPRCVFTVARFTYSSKYWLASELAGPNSFVCSEVSNPVVSGSSDQPPGVQFWSWVSLSLSRIGFPYASF